MFCPPFALCPAFKTRLKRANCAPLSLGPTEQSRYSTRFGIEGKDFPPGQYPVAQVRWVTPDYFRVLGIPLKHGRLLTMPMKERRSTQSTIPLPNDSFRAKTHWLTGSSPV